MAQSDDKPLDQEALAEAYNRALALEKLAISMPLPKPMRKFCKSPPTITAALRCGLPAWGAVRFR